MAEMTNELIDFDDLVDNPTPRVPVCLCLDCSGSMNGEPIAELNEGVKIFYQSIYDDEIARYSAEVSVVTFGGSVRQETNFQTLDQNHRPPILSASGGTPMGEAVKIALDSLDKRKTKYQNNGVDYYQPWLVLMTDGRPGDVIDIQAKRVCDLVENRKLVVFPIGIGPNVDMNVLAKFSPEWTPLRLKGLRFSDFFSWLSKSVSKVSQSTPGDETEIDKEGIKGWAQI